MSIDYTYDGLSRLIEADYDNGTTVKSYGYDLAGNMVNMNGTTRTYNAANQMTYDGTNTLTYDANGNLTNDGTNSYTWDRANRLLSHGGLSYAYDGLGNRVSQDNGSVVTKYLLDTQPGLAVVLRESDGTNTNHYVHGLRGIHAQYDGSAWEYMMQDGLNSVRGLVDASAAVQQSISYGEYGEPDTSLTGFAFTGEQRDTNGLQYHRARYYDPELATWASLDPLETPNRYAYVSGNPVNRIDPTGMQDNADFDVGDLPDFWLGIGTGVAAVGFLALPKDSLADGIETFWNDICLPALQVAAFTYAPHLYSPFLNSSTGTLQPGDFDIPIPDICIGAECDEYAEQLLKNLQTLVIAGSLAESLRNLNFTIYADGGEVVPPGLTVTGAEVENPENTIMEPYLIKSYGFIVGRPPRGVGRSTEPITLENMPDPSAFIYPLISGRAAVHMYLEFRLGSASQVYDNQHPFGGATITDFHANLEGVSWRNCRLYQGVTRENLRRALGYFPTLFSQARFGFERNPSQNRLGTDCPLG